MMQLTTENKAYIDSLSIEQLLRKWRFHLIGEAWLQDETGKYWGKRVFEMRENDNSAWERASKNIGWG